jgi:APA family basic amino acid/polyamine antiporter
VLKFVPLLFMATIGLLFIRVHNFGPFNAGGTSAGSAISAAAAIALFSYIGIETASVAAGRVRDPRRNVGRATVLGTIGCAVVYILGTLTVFGTVSNAALRASSAPFTDSADAIFGGRWAGQTVAVAAIVSGLGALIGWTLVVGEMPMAAAKDRLFPAVFARTRRGVPVFGIVSSTLLASVLTAVSYTRFEKVFTTLVLLSVVTAVIPYLFSAGAQLYWLLTCGRQTRWQHLVRDCGVSGVALVFSFWSLAGSGYQAVYYGLFCLLLGLPVYIWLKVGRGEYGESLVVPFDSTAALTDPAGPPGTGQLPR